MPFLAWDGGNRESKLRNFRRSRKYCVDVVSSWADRLNSEQKDAILEELKIVENTVGGWYGLQMRQ